MIQATYTVVFVRDPHGAGYWIRVPALGCATEADGLQGAIHAAEEAIAAYLDGEGELGKPIPADVDVVPVELGEANEALVLRMAVSFEEAVHGVEH